MAAHAARRLADMNANLAQILGIELLVASQGIELRAPFTTSEPLQRVIKTLRRSVHALGGDRYLAADLQTAAALVESGRMSAAARSALKTDALPCLSPSKARVRRK
jgi:histidine ammonia-lyase